MKMSKPSLLDILRPASEGTRSIATTNSPPSFLKPLPSEGNLYSWLTVAGSLLVYYSSFGIVNSFGFFQNYYQQVFLLNTSLSTVALIGTLQIALMNLLSTVSGALCDMYGVKV
jgi:MFS transporter, MCT family, solute carrier family 16 (monocarboxylic acid transporters), member 10